MQKHTHTFYSIQRGPIETKQRIFENIYLKQVVNNKCEQQQLLILSVKNALIGERIKNRYDQS